MTEQQKKEIAVFRFGVICEFVTGPMCQGSCRLNWTKNFII